MNSNQNIKAVIMAAGKGTRMKSNLAKVLHALADKPIIYYSIQNLLKVLPLENIYVVISHQANLVRKNVEQSFKVNFVYQKEPLGTADAVKSATREISKSPQALLVVGADDSAFYSQATLEYFIKSHLKEKPSITMMTLIKKGGNTVAKVFRDQDGNFLQLMENFQYLDSGNKSDEINCGAYIFDFKWIKKYIPEVKLSEERGEYLLTDLLKIAKQNGDKINLFRLKNEKEWVGINTPEELAQANKLIKNK